MFFTDIPFDAYSALVPAEMDGRAAAGAQLQGTGDEVGLEVAEQDVGDLEPEFFGQRPGIAVRRAGSRR